MCFVLFSSPWRTQINSLSVIFICGERRKERFRLVACCGVVRIFMLSFFANVPEVVISPPVGVLTIARLR